MLNEAFIIQHSSFIIYPSEVVSRPLPFRHIAIEGPISAGTTPRVTRLAKRFRGTKILEEADNPSLDDFYKDKRSAAFRCQLFFLLSRFDQQRQGAPRDLFKIGRTACRG